MSQSTPGRLAQRGNLRGVAAMIVGVGSFSLMDACLKALSPHYSALQVASLRGLSTLPIVIVWVGVRGGYGQLVNVRFPFHVARAAIGIVMLVTFTYGLRQLPLAEAYSIFFVAPLLITVLAVPILREHVDWRRWLAIGVGFLGVLVVLRPSRQSALTIPALAVLVCAIGYALSAITVRVLGRTDTTESMVFWLMTMIGVGAGLLAIPQWRPIHASDWPVVAALGATGALGQWAITEAFNRGEASLIAPFEYTALVWGVMLDWLIWRTAPRAITLIGAAIIIASGVYLIRRERVHVESERP